MIKLQREKRTDLPLLVGAGAAAAEGLTSAANKASVPSSSAAVLRHAICIINALFVSFSTSSRMVNHLWLTASI